MHSEVSREELRSELAAEIPLEIIQGQKMMSTAAQGRDRRQLLGALRESFSEKRIILLLLLLE